MTNIVTNSADDQGLVGELLTLNGYKTSSSNEDSELFWPIIEDLGETKTLAEWSAEHIKTHGRPLRVAVDEAHWRYRAPNAAAIADIQKGAEGSKPIEKNILYRIFRLLRLGIHPILVFDGDLRPAVKRARKSKLGNAGGNITLLKELLDHLNVPWHQAPGEAEAECVRMQELKIVDAVWTEDNDAFMFGCEVVVKKTKNPDTVKIFRMKDVEQRGFSKESLVLFAMLSGCDYTDGLMGCGKAVALSVVQSEAVRQGDFLEQFWDIETEAARTAWCKRLKNILPNERGRANVHDRKFAPIQALRDCRRPVVSRPDQLERLRQKRFRGYTLEKLQTTVPFLQAHFNRDKKLTWPLEQLAPIQVAHRLLSREPGARELVEAFKQKNKLRLTSPLEVDPVRVFPGINSREIRSSLFESDPITMVTEELLDVICGLGMNEKHFIEWRGSIVKARVNQKQPKEISTPRFDWRIGGLPSSDKTPTSHSPAANKSASSLDQSLKRKADDITVRRPPFELPRRGADDRFWLLDSSQESVEAGAGGKVARTFEKPDTETNCPKDSLTPVFATSERYSVEPLWANGTGRSFDNPVVLDD